jgi:hypothetical protein
LGERADGGLTSTGEDSRLAVKGATRAEASVEVMQRRSVFHVPALSSSTGTAD